MKKSKKEQVSNIVEIIKHTGNAVSDSINLRNHISSNSLIKYIALADNIKTFNKNKFNDAYINSATKIISSIENNIDFYKNGTVARLKDMLILKCKSLGK